MAGNKMKRWFILVAVVLCLVGILVTKNSTSPIDDGVEVIGALFPLTGNLANQGRNVANAFLLAGEDLNGLTGKCKYFVDLQDTKADPKVAGLIVQRMLTGNRKPSLVFSLVSSVVLHIQPFTERSGTVLFGFVGTEHLFESHPKLTYRGMPSAEQIAESVVAAFKQMSARRVLLLYPNTAYGVGYGGAVLQKCKECKIDLLGVRAYAEQAAGYANEVVAAGLKNAQCVFLTGAGDNLGVMLKVLREQGYKGPILCDLNLTPTIIQNSHASTKDLYQIDYAAPKGPRYEDFAERYEKRFGSKPDALSAICYDLFYLYNKAKEDLGNDVWKNKELIETWHCESMLGPVYVKDFEIVLPLEMRHVD